MKSAIGRPMVFAFLMLALVSLACGIDLGTESPTAAPPAATSVPALTTAPSTDLGRNFTEEFDGDVDAWTYFVTKNDAAADDSGAQPETENGFLVFDLDKNLNVYVYYDPQTYRDVRIDASVENRGVNVNNVNLICRWTDDGWYEVSVANSGLYDIYAFTDAYHRLANGGSNEIRQGFATNEYALICNDNVIRLLINGDETKSFTDNQYGLTEGRVGVGVSSFDREGVEAAFDWVTVTEAE